MDLLIKSARVLDPASNLDAVSDILIEEGKIKSIGPNLRARANAINAKGMLALPGLIDMHCHLRDPGDPEDETIASGTRAAAKGGFTSVCAMANTDPPIDSPAMVRYLLSRAANEGVVNVLPIGAVTKGIKGEEITEMGRMVLEGAVAFSDDGKPVLSSAVLRRALEYSHQFDIPIICHSEDPSLSFDGLMNEGFTSTILGLGGIPSLAEEVMVMRDIMLAREFGRAHIAHVSTARSVELIRRAKNEGIKVTCETCPHYFTLTEEEVEGYNTNAKVNPPLRSEKDLEAILAGLKEGVIDVIATDHAPHKQEKKNVEFGAAANGMIGFETALALVLTELVDTKFLPLKKAIEKMTVNPAKILNLQKGALKPGWDADLILVNPDREWLVDVNKFASRSKNSPYGDWRLKGLVMYTIVQGKMVVKNGELAA